MLRYKYLPADDDDELRWERHVRKTTIGPRESPFRLNPAWPPDLVADFVKSWERIFDVKPGLPTQTTVDLMRPYDVVDTVSSPNPNDVPPRFWATSNSTYVRARSFSTPVHGERPHRGPSID